MIDIDTIIKQHDTLEHQLNLALATMERKSKIYEIRTAILENQNLCPHFSEKYNWPIIDNICPYCGRKL